MDYGKIGFKPADILIPQNIDMNKWSVVACDQYTSEPKYWEEVEKIVGENPSALHITFPEIYLADDNSKRINKINNTMEEYIKKGIFKEYKNALIYTERVIGGGKVRHGLVGAVDLEAYDFGEKSKSLIRATEGTVIERIPPRVKIRENAPLESPHIMILIDDDKKEIIEKIDKSTLQKVYDFDLMMDSGHITGYLVEDTDEICAKFEKLLETQGENPLLFAMGDGNHSLATAKTCWENIKKEIPETEWANHPARYALAEIVNIHDTSMEFEPIHRVVFDVNPKDLLNEFLECENGILGEGKGQQITVVYGDTKQVISIENPSHTLEVGTLQKFLDEYLKKQGKIDYIHGEDVVLSLSSKPNSIGFILPGMDKSDLFKAIKNDGVLPRKTFSIGEAKDKRFYLECRYIR